MHNVLAEKFGFDLGHQGRASAIADPKLEEALFSLVTNPR